MDQTENLAAVKAGLERALLLAHQSIDDFEVENIADEILRAEKEIRVILRDWIIVLASLAAISLLVGSVGIYSVLRISLAERLYEIGLWKAIGVSDEAILAQILVESTGLSILGVLVGVALGLGLARTVSSAFEGVLPPTPARLTPEEAMRGEHQSQTLGVIATWADPMSLPGKKRWCMLQLCPGFSPGTGGLPGTAGAPLSWAGFWRQREALSVQPLKGACGAGWRSLD